MGRAILVGTAIVLLAASAWVGATEAVLFTEAGCPRCTRVQAILQLVQATGVALTVKQYDISSHASQDLLSRLLTAYGADLGPVPMLFVGDVAIVGDMLYRPNEAPVALAGHAGELEVQKIVEQAIAENAPSPLDRLPGGAVTAEQTPSCAIFVQPGESIQAVIDAASGGAVICLPAGEWREHLIIGKSLSLRGAGDNATTIRGYEEDKSVITVDSSPDDACSLILAGLTVTGGVGEGSTGIALRESAQATITYCTVSGSGWGVGLSDSAKATITESSIEDNRLGGIGIDDFAEAAITRCFLDYNVGFGIALGDSAQATVADCTFYHNDGLGVALGGSARATMTNCTFHENSNIGIGLEALAQATMTNCTFLINDNSGVELYNSAQGIITRCTFYWSECAIVLADSAQATIKQSEVHGCTIGLEIRDSARGAVEASTFEGNTVTGIGLEGSAQATIDTCTSTANLFGILLADSSLASITGCDISGNEVYAVALYEPPCFNKNVLFTGRVAGAGNTIPGPDQPDANTGGRACPDELSFLMTEEGGELDRRPQ